jgi:hypothetical protein
MPIRQAAASRQISVMGKSASNQRSSERGPIAQMIASLVRDPGRRGPAPN